MAGCPEMMTLFNYYFYPEKHHVEVTKQPIRIAKLNHVTDTQLFDWPGENCTWENFDG